jgi:adenosylcobyric acid synthase
VGEKATYQARAKITSSTSWLSALSGQTVSGYEIHMGRTTGAQPWLEIITRGGQPTSQVDGAIAGDGRVWGCYLHGLFANDNLRRAWLASLGWQPPTSAAPPLGLDAAFDRLADHVEHALNMAQLEEIIGW